MRVLDLFAGGGGSIWAGKLLGWQTVCTVELDKGAKNILRLRQRDGIFEEFPIHDDISAFDGNDWRGRVDLVTAGFPCQPWSTAGKRRGPADERNLWPELARVLGEVRPSYALLENSPELAVHPYFWRVLGDLAEIGFDAEWGCLAARDVGAPHGRERLWILAYREGGDGRLPVCGRGPLQTDPEPRGSGEGVADAECERVSGSQLGEPLGSPCALQGDGEERQRLWIDYGTGGEPVGDSERARCSARDAGHLLNPAWQPEPRHGEVVNAVCAGQQGSGLASGVQPAFPCPWPPSPTGDWTAIPEHLWPATAQPVVRRVADGLASRRDRIRALGNGWVPSVAASAFRLLLARAQGVR